MMIDAQSLLLRDGILLLAWLTAVYLVYMLLTLAQLGQQRGQGGNIPMIAAVMPQTASPDAALPMAVQPKAADSPSILCLSPRYDVAVSLTFQGFDVADIARRCDISVTEARWVAALVKNVRGLENSREQEHGAGYGTRVAA